MKIVILMNYVLGDNYMPGGETLIFALLIGMVGVGFLMAGNSKQNSGTKRLIYYFSFGICMVIVLMMIGSFGPIIGLIVVVIILSNVFHK